MVVLWTDALIYLLVIAVIALSIYVGKRSQFKRPLQKIAASKTGMLSLVVLIFFAAIGLLDSIHFKSN